MNAVTLHRVSWSDPDIGNRQQWFTTWNKAMQFARREGISDGASFDQVEIPKTRIALCEWLNKNFDTDNG